MATAILEVKPNECAVCLEYYKEPKILPCAHLLCRNCLVSWMKTNKNAQCPLCRCAIEDPHNRAVKTCDEVADELPTDEVMSEMVVSIKSFNLKRVCYVHKDMKAKSFCLHCGFMLCTTCAEVHIKIPATSSHRLEDQEKLTLESLTSSRQSQCSAHPDKTSNLYCVMHDVRICNECALSKHRACPEVSRINELLEKSKQSLSEMENRLNAVESTLNQIMSDIENDSVSLEQNTKAYLALIDAVCDRLVLSIENCRKRLKKNMQDEHDNVMAGACKHKESLGHIRGLINSHRSLINRIQRSASCTSLVTMVPRLNKRVNDLDRNTPLLSIWKPLTIAKLTIDEKVLSRIELELSRLVRPNPKSFLVEEQAVWRFHRNHGKHIALRNNGLTAESMALDYGMVFSSEPMKVNLLYEAQMEETDTRFDGSYVGFGLVTKDPATITTNLPEYSTGLQSAIVVLYDNIYVKKQPIPHSDLVAFNTLKVGSRIGVAVDATRCLHIYVDGKDQGVVYRDVQLPCYAMFDLYIFITKVTVLPLTRIS